MQPNGTATYVRPPAVAGLFYPDEPYELRAVVQRYLDAAPHGGERPKALIVPHAGYSYSGPTAAAAYRHLLGLDPPLRRVVLAGPSHRAQLRGVALPDATAFGTPLGEVPLDAECAALLSAMPGVSVDNLPHRAEHSLEVQLPFLQVVLGHFSLVPLAVGDTDPVTVAEILEACWGGAETLIVISTDLSHFLDYDTARALDSATARSIVDGATDFGGEQACGCRALNGLMRVARRRRLRVEALDLRNSGDTSGDRDRVVGYGAFSLHGH